MVGQLMVVSHTDLTEVTGMELIHVGSVVVLTTGETSTTGMLPVLTDTTVTGRNVTSVLSSVGESGRHSEEDKRGGMVSHVDHISIGFEATAADRISRSAIHPSL